MATCLCHQNGILEFWNSGILGVLAEINHFNCKKLLQNHHSITPLFHYSNWGEAPKFILSHFNLMILKKNNKRMDLGKGGIHVRYSNKSHKEQTLYNFRR